jgi:hypothetical protein
MAQLVRMHLELKAGIVSRRRDTLSFKHHAEVVSLPAEEADRLLDWCEESIAATLEANQRPAGAVSSEGIQAHTGNHSVFGRFCLCKCGLFWRCLVYTIDT